MACMSAGCGSDEPLRPESTSELVELGRHLFYERRLSLNENRSCGICHEQAKGFTDGFVRAVGTEGDVHPRNTLTILNAGSRETLSWLTPTKQTLAEQLLIPLLGESPVEMGGKGIIDRVIGELNADPVYIALLTNLDAASELSIDLIAEALQAFMETLISRDSPYDRAVAGLSTLPPEVARGAELFFSSKIGCAQCHGGIDFDEPDDNRHGWFNTGLYNVGDSRYPAGREGLWEVTQDVADIGRYRTPTLRHLALTGPYYHDGSGATLKDVLANYNRGGRLTTSGPYAGDGRLNRFKDPRIQPLGLSDRQLDDLEAFLLSLTDKRIADHEDWSDPWPRTD
ncbi:MAG: cytochrome c peroxidase [Myxococcota bacterium]|nr:cytochrome c peroxidase [Myxococcota bacterium]